MQRVVPSRDGDSAGTYLFRFYWVGTVFAWWLGMETPLLSFSSDRWTTTLLDDVRALMETGALWEAELTCRQAIVEIEGCFGEQTIAGVEAHMMLAELRFQDGDLSEAQQQLQQVIRLLSRMPDQGPAVCRLRVQALGRQGLIAVLAGSPEEGLPLLRQALLRARRQLGPSDAEVRCCLNALAFASRRSGRLSLAASQLREALRCSAGAPPEQVALLHRNLACLELERGRPERGEPHARAAIALLQRAGNPVAAVQVLLAQLIQRRDVAEAEQVLREAIPSLEESERQEACRLMAALLAQQEDRVQAGANRWRAEAA